MKKIFLAVFVACGFLQAAESGKSKIPAPVVQRGAARQVKAGMHAEQGELSRLPMSTCKAQCGSECYHKGAKLDISDARGQRLVRILLSRLENLARGFKALTTEEQEVSRKQAQHYLERLQRFVLEMKDGDAGFDIAEQLANYQAIFEEPEAE